MRFPCYLPTTPIVGILTVLAIACSTSALGAAEVVPATPAPVMLNTVCPMDGMALDPARPHSVMMSVGAGAGTKHFQMGCCSMACETEFSKDPGKVLQPLLIGGKGGERRKGGKPTP